MVRLKGLEPTHIAVREPKSRMSTNSITGARILTNPIAEAIGLWSGQRGSNSLPPPWQGGALPDELCPHQHSYFNTFLILVNVYFYCYYTIVNNDIIERGKNNAD